MKSAFLTMKPVRSVLTALTAALLAIGAPALNALDVITFDETIEGLQSVSFDSGSDGLPDAIFTTQDPAGFNTIFTNPAMPTTETPEFEGRALLVREDFRVDFPGGAVGNLQFCFGLYAYAGAPQSTYPGVNLSIYDANGNLLNDGYQSAEDTSVDGTTTIFPKSTLSVNFPGVAAYGVLDFDSATTAYLIDTFTGTYNAADNNVAAAGSLPESALLPTNVDDPFYLFAFDVGVDGLGTDFPIFVDPDVAVGYEYEVASGSPLMAAVFIPAALPNGDADFTLSFGGNDYALTAGVLFDITTVNSGSPVDYFTITDISTDEALNPSDPMAFVTGITFYNAGTVQLTQTPITEFVGSGGGGGCQYSADGNYDVLMMILLACGIFYGRNLRFTRD